MVLSKQTPLQAEGPPLCKPPATAPPGGLTGITGQDVAPLSGFSVQYCAPRPSSQGSQGDEMLVLHGIPASAGETLIQ